MKKIVAILILTLTSLLPSSTQASTEAFNVPLWGIAAQATIAYIPLMLSDPVLKDRPSISNMLYSRMSYRTRTALLLTSVIISTSSFLDLADSRGFLGLLHKAELLPEDSSNLYQSIIAIGLISIYALS